MRHREFLRLYGYQPIFKKSKTDPAAGIAMGALHVLPSNKCGAHETFHDWSIHPYAATCVVPSVSRAFLWTFLWAFLMRKLASSILLGKIHIVLLAGEALGFERGLC
jgi:hypothetical protein